VKLIKEKRKVYREFIQSRDPLLKTLFNKLNAQIRRDINIYREETWIKTCESLDYRDGKKFWNKFKVITGQKRKTNHYLATDAHIYYTPQERANCFAELLDGIHQVPNDPNFNATFFDQIANNVHAFKNIPLISSDLAFVSDGRDSSSVLSDRQGDCLVFVVLCSVPVPRPVFSTRSARFAYICAVLRSSPANRPHNSLQRGPHWRKCRSSAFSSIHLKDPVLLHHKL
jgi:hypothetical protein